MEWTDQDECGVPAEMEGKPPGQHPPGCDCELCENVDHHAEDHNTADCRHCERQWELQQEAKAN